MTNTAAQNPLGTEKISKLMLKFSIPAIISFLVNAIYNIVDQIFIGWGIGTTGIAATNIALPLTTICTATSLMLGIGGASNFNLSLGGGRPQRASSVAGNSITLLAISGIILGALSIIFLNPMLVAFGATPEIMPYAEPYTLIIAIGVPFTVFAVGAGHLIRADGSPTYAMICVMSGAIFNLIFDPIFMFVFGWGIAGIAWATTLGQVLSCIIAIIYFARKFKSVPLEKEHFRPRVEYAKAICSLGAASCFNQLAMTVVQITMNNTLRHYGALSVYGSEIPLACVGVVSKVNIIFLGVVLGIAQGSQPINSFNYGAGNYARVKKAYQTALLSATIVSVLTFLVFQFFPRQIAMIFGKGTEEYFEFATLYLRVYMMMAFINGIQPVTSNFFTSIGKARVGIVISLTRQIIFLLPLLILLPMALGIHGVLYSGPISDSAAAVLAITFAVREMRRLTNLQRESEMKAASEPPESQPVLKV